VSTTSDHSFMTLAKVQEQAKDLSAAERAELLEWLWETLQSEGTMQRQERWAADAEERIKAVDGGKLSTVDGPWAMRELRKRLEA
jgi:putative addiction module component (TIGR02574 family)